MPKCHPPEFRRKVLDLLDAGRKVAEIAPDLLVTQQTIYTWRRQHLIDADRMVHGLSRGTYGARRVHAEFRLGRQTETR